MTAQFNRPHITFSQSSVVTMYLVSFLRYSTLNNGMLLESGLEVI